MNWWLIGDMVIYVERLPGAIFYGASLVKNRLFDNPRAALVRNAG